MTQVLVTEGHLMSIAEAIRLKNGSEDLYRPGDMGAAIRALTPKLQAKTAEANGEVTPDAGYDGLSGVTVDVQPRLQAKTANFNGLVLPDDGYDGLSQVDVNISGSLVVPQGTLDFAAYINKNVVVTVNPTTQAGTFSGIEYSGYIYNRTAMLEALGLVLLGDFSQTGAASGNALKDSIENYCGVVLQGIYNKSRTSQYNTTMLYTYPELNKAYWAGMKDRNASYDCKVTFTDEQTVSLTGNRQVIIYGLP